MLSPCVLNSKEILRKFNPRSRDVSINIDLNNEEQVSKLVKIYSTYQAEFSAVVILIKFSEDPTSPRIANIYGKFDASKLGGSFNLPPQSSTETPVVDMTIQQMTAYKNDTAGTEFFQGPNSPPPCDEFNYNIMSMDVSAEGDVKIKPKGWKTGDSLPYVLKTSTMTQLSLEDIQNISVWCKAYTVAANPTPQVAANPTSQNAAAQPQVGAQPLALESKNNAWWIALVVVFGFGLLCLVYAYRSYK